MISDDRLKKIAESVAVQEYDSAYVALGDVKDMAQELLQRRKAEGTVWQNAPDWANWFAIDDDGCITWFENRPSHNDSFWYPDGGRYGTESLDGWQSTLQERPK